MNKPPGLSKLKILRALAAFGVMTSEQLTAVCFAPTSFKWCEQNLLELTGDEETKRPAYIWRQRMVIPARGLHSYPYLCGLEKKGIREVERHYEVAFPLKPLSEAERAFQRGHLHDLTINDVLLSALALARSHPEYAVEHWVHGRSLRQLLAGQEAVPDGYLRFVHRNQHHVIFLEVDESGKEEEQRWKEKVVRLCTTVQAPVLHEYVQADALTIAVVVVRGEGRRNKLRRWTHEALGNQAAYFVFSSVLPTRLSPHAYFTSSHWYLPDSDQQVSLLDP